MTKGTARMQAAVRERRIRVFVTAATIVWAVAVVIGMRALLAYKNTPSAGADARESWPRSSKLALAAELPTLVMFVHPKCTCSRASMTELSILMTEMRGKVVTRVVFMKPADTEDGWEQTDTWQTARSIAGVTVSTDVDGAEADRFGARTSGQVLLYGVDGDLMYAGGITTARGHVGNNVGLERIEALLNAGSVDERTGPVYGCALADPASGSAKDHRDRM